MSLLRVPPELEAIVARPGRDWTPAERRCIVVWLNEGVQRRYLLSVSFSKIAGVFAAAAASEAEDVWASFCADHLDYIMRMFDPVKGPFEPFLLLGLTQHARKEAANLRLRSERSASETTADGFAAPADDPERILLRGEKERWLQAGVNALPPGERAVVVQHYFRDKKLKEIASLLGISLESTKVRLHRARRRLKGHLGSESL